MINRNRDSYQVPLALAERGLLTRFVTDFYAPSGRMARILPRFLRQRRVNGLERRQTLSVLSSFVLQAVAHVFRLDMSRTFAVADRLLARAANRVARRTDAALYCYHSYVPANVDRSRPLVIFAYHPMPGTEIQLLEAEARAYPEIAAAIARDRRISPPEPSIDWKCADAVVCASSFTAASLIAEGCAFEKIAVIPYGSPFNSDTNAQRRTGREVAEFLFVGQGIPRKGLHHLIKAWQASPPPHARLTIVSYIMVPEIAALIDHPSIRVIDYLPRDDLDRLFSEADVFVMPSVVEGFGLVYCEALAHGCHVIGTANTGLPDLDLDAEAVTLIEVGNIGLLSKTLHDRSERALGMGFDRAHIVGQAARWTRADFRRAIAEHAAAVLSNA